jgi:hypothetical protein
MTSENFVDLEKLTKRLEKQGRAAFSEWTATAHEVAPKHFREISRHYGCYSDLADSELENFRFRSFVDGLFGIMPSDAARRSLANAMATPTELKNPTKA